MKKIMFTAAALLLATPMLWAQGSAADYADDAYRYSDSPLNGTARFRALGGNHAALGADASNVIGNPAGLGFYNRSEASISPSMNLVNNSNAFLGTTATSSAGKFSVGNASLIFAGRDPSPNSRWRRSTFGFSYSQSANFFDFVDAQGLNNNQNSSIVLPIIDEANAAGYTGAQLNDQYSNGVATTREGAAYQLYLINPTDLGNGTAGPPFFRYDGNTQKNQRATLNRSGSMAHWTLAYGGNLDDKLYLGAGLSIAHMRYMSDYTFNETPVNGVTFANYGQINTLDVRGTGFNFSAGLMYKVTPGVMLGANLISPSFIANKETFGQSLFANAKDPDLIARNPPTTVEVQNESDLFAYTLQTPLRASAGATFFVGKSGFVTATAEYVGYGGMRVRTSTFGSSQDNTNFANDVKANVQETYQNVVNLRAGGEVRTGLFRIRAGVGYLPSAYKFDLDRVAKADRAKLLLSAGVGARTDRFFIDLSGSYITSKAGFSPYQLGDADTPTVLTSMRNTNATLSIGTFF